MSIKIFEISRLISKVDLITIEFHYIVPMRQWMYITSHQEEDSYQLCNGNKENNAFDKHNHQTTKPTNSPRSRKRYHDMRRHHVKVTYNSMGEAVKKKINLDQKRLLRRRRWKLDHEYARHDQYVPQCNMKHRHTKRQFMVKRRETSYSLSDLTKSVHVLREVLLGKLSRDMMYSRSLNEFPLPEMLRFYCETTFGATSIADCRQTDLFNAILALQRMSPFLRTMKRMLSIPGIKTYSDDVTYIYFQMWTWLMTNDVILDYECQLQYCPEFMAIDDDTKLKRLLVTKKSFFDCFAWIKETYDHSFPGGFIDDLEGKISQLECYNIARGAGQRDEHLFDIDGMLENMLDLLEDLDEDVKAVENNLFGSSVVRNKIIAPSNSVVGEIKDDDFIFRHSLRRIKTLLNQCILEDESRDGYIQYVHFRRLLQDWFASSNHKTQFDRSEFKKLFELFQSDDDSVAAANYVYFVGVLYTILTNEQTLPSMKDILMYFSGFNRGIEAHHYALLNEYVAKVRLKATEEHHLAQDDPDVGNIANESRRTIVKSKMTTHDSKTDFMAKWLTTGSLRKEYRNSIIESLHASQEMNKRSPLKRTKHIRPKTPVHLVELHGDFDKDMSDIFKFLDIKDEETNNDKDNLDIEMLSSHMKHFEVNSACHDHSLRPSSCTSVQTHMKQSEANLGRQNPACHDYSVRPSSCTSVQIAFKGDLSFNCLPDFEDPRIVSRTNLRPTSERNNGSLNQQVNKVDDSVIDYESIALSEYMKIRVTGTLQPETDCQPPLKPKLKGSLTNTLLENVLDHPNSRGNIDGYDFQTTPVEFQRTSVLGLHPAPIQGSAADLSVGTCRDCSRRNLYQTKQTSTPIIQSSLTSDERYVSSKAVSSEVEGPQNADQNEFETELSNAVAANESISHPSDLLFENSLDNPIDHNFFINLSRKTEEKIDQVGDLTDSSQSKCCIAWRNGGYLSLPLVQRVDHPRATEHHLVLETFPTQLFATSYVRAATSSYMKLLQLESITHEAITINQWIDFLLPLNTYQHENTSQTENSPKLSKIVIQNGAFSSRSRQITKSISWKYETAKRHGRDLQSLSSKDSTPNVQVECHDISSTPTRPMVLMDVGLPANTSQTFAMNSDVHCPTNATVLKEDTQLELINFVVVDRWQLMFEENESILLGILCKFHLHHHDLQLARCRHRLDKNELKNITACLSTLRRIERNRQVEQHVIRCLQSPTFGKVDIQPIKSLGIGIKSLILAAKRRKERKSRNMSNRCNPTISKSYLYGQKIKIINYRIGK